MTTTSKAPKTLPRASPFLERISQDATLREAWYRVQRSNSTGGIDGIGVRQFRTGIEQRLDRLRRWQVVPSPIFNDGRRIIFEFQHAYIMRVERWGQLETRYVALHAVTGLVGTRTIHRFDARWLGLVNRCVEHLAGVLDLFPLMEPRLLRWQRIDVPHGEAALEFTGHRRSADSRGAGCDIPGNGSSPLTVELPEG